MNTALWIVAIVTALLFGFSGAYKVFATGKYRAGAAWARSVDARTITTIGVIEILGAIGIVLPQWTGVLPWLTVVAGFCLALMQLVAMGLHVHRAEYAIVPINLVLPGSARVAVVRRSRSTLVGLAVVIVAIERMTVIGG